DGTGFARVRAFDACQSVNSRLGDKSRPSALALGSDGRVYGTALTDQAHARGDVFSVRPDTLGYAVTYGFENGGDARGGLVRGPAGNLYVPTFDLGASATQAVMHLQPLGSSKAGALQVSTVSAPTIQAPHGSDGPQASASPDGSATCTNPWQN